MEFPKTKGGLWSHEKTSEKQPDVKGHVEITRDVLRMLVNQAKAGVGDIKIQIAGWDRTAQSNGQRYIYLTGEAWVPKEHQDAVQAAAASDSNDAPPPPPVDSGKDPWD
tara:strand:- start:416 stop:742 length:327 start_codon:yes stop_codon:yes gene_type:complete